MDDRTTLMISVWDIESHCLNAWFYVAGVSTFLRSKCKLVQRREEEGSRLGGVMDDDGWTKIVRAEE